MGLAAVSLFHTDRFCFEDDVHNVEVYEVEIMVNFNTVLRLKPVAMGKEELDNNADIVEQPAAS